MSIGSTAGFHGTCEYNSTRRRSFYHQVRPTILLVSGFLKNSFNRNCAFHVPAHEAMLTSDTESVRSTLTSTSAPGINVLPYVLLPLAGPEEFDLDVSWRIYCSHFRKLSLSIYACRTRSDSTSPCSSYPKRKSARPIMSYASHMLKRCYFCVPRLQVENACERMARMR